MNKFDYDEHEAKKSFFIKGIIVIIAGLVFFMLGAMFMLGTLSIVNKVSPLDLLKGQVNLDENKEAAGNPPPEISGKGSSVSEGKTVESLPGLDEKIANKDMLLEGLDMAISELIKEVSPSVVNIRVMVKNENIFGEEVIGEGLGSGIIYDKEGYIITNAHVAGDAIELLATLWNGDEYEAELIGADKNTDIAVIKIDASGLKAARFASIDNMEVGDMVIAVGSPFGLQQTVTMGLISAKGRDITLSPETLPMVNLIQTDAAINQGNSGGPLINTSGQVIGINTLIFSPSGASAGIGFSIPSDTAVNIASQIIQFGKARIPFIGIEMGENSTNIVGVYINSAMEGSPAEEAGIRRGDIITKLEGEEVTNPYELYAQILRHNVGDLLDLEIYRDGEYITITLELAEAPATEAAN